MSRSPRFFVPSLALLMTAGTLPVLAQPSRADVVVRRGARAEPADSIERQLRPLQRQLDSLTRLYNESDELSVAERRRVAEAMRVAIERMTELTARGGGEFHFRVFAPSPERSAVASAMSRSMFESQAAQLQAMPKGWLGFTVLGSGMPSRIEQGELIVRYFSYPGVVSVDPSSPAQRAGITPGDTLIAYDGLDVRDNDISLTRLLRPSARVSVRLRRDGHLRDVPVVVAAAPQRIVQRRDDESRDRRETWVVSGVPDAPSFPRLPAPPTAQGNVGAMRVTVGTAPTPPQAAAGVSAGQLRPSFVVALANGVAGAQMAAITDGLARVIGVSSGVLVTAVPVGSPANESGLLDGDVIARVAGRAVRSVLEVRQLVGMASDNGERSVELEILREKKSQRLTLRW